MNQIPCSVCSEAGHKAHKCPTLSSPLQSGFYKPAGGYRGGGDDEDDSLRKVRGSKSVQPVLVKNGSPGRVQGLL